ncbi:MAG TPA: hydroxysqualene dehydroxylase HpnE, partial [Candidatus Methylacidiphilales bacterium]
AFWRAEVARACSGGKEEPLSPLGRELGEIVREFGIPQEPLDEILNGVEMDLVKSRYATFAELEQYCYRVASAVGLVSIEIFGYRNPVTKEYAVALGMAFQLTNILRDVKKDSTIDRVYLPADELAEFGLSEKDIFDRNFTPAMRKFLKFQAFRARHYYAKALRLIDPADRPNLIAAEVMREVYEGILDKIEKHDFDVFTHKVGLTKAEKVLAILRAKRREKKAAPLPPPPKEVLVLGGGFAGVAAALDLIHRGHSVTLLEAKPSLGGRAGSFTEAKSGEVLDSGQHVLMGCYEASLRLLDTLDAKAKLHVQPRLDVPFLSPRGASSLTALNLPAPFHLLSALAGFKELTWGDRLAALKLGLQLRLGHVPGADETADAWLKRLGQPPRLVNALWEPMCLAALNQSLSGSSARLLATVLKRALLASAEGSKLIVSRVGLGELLSPDAETLHRWCGGKVVHGAHVKRLLVEEGRVAGAETLDGTVYRAAHVVSALPWNALRGLLPEGEGTPLRETCAAIPDSPIVSLHLWFDRPILDGAKPFVGFLDSPVHWLFDRQAITGHRSPLGPSYVAVISGATAQKEMTPAAMEAQALAEIVRFLPDAKKAQVVHRFIYKAKGATFGATPAVEKIRPGAATPWPNFHLAGDWTDTGLPGTIEGAAWSGYRAAAQVDEADEADAAAN